MIKQSPREGNGTPLQYSCLENPRDGGAWQAAVHGVDKSRTRLSDFPFTFHFHSLEKEMATHSSVLAWRIPGTGSLVGCCLWGRTESDMTEATQQQQQEAIQLIFSTQTHIHLLSLKNSYTFGYATLIFSYKFTLSLLMPPHFLLSPTPGTRYSFLLLRVLSILDSPYK